MILVYVIGYLWVLEARFRAVVHVGPHKTGSSHLQGHIIANRRRFEELGWLVVGSRRLKEGAVFAYTLKHLYGDKEETRRRGRLFNRASFDVMAHTIRTSASRRSLLLSSEEFDDMGEAAVAKLGQILAGYDVRVVAFHRERTHHLRSVWWERTKHEVPPVPFDEWAPGFLADRGGKPGWFDLRGLVTRYAAVFGAANVSLLSYDGLLRGEGLFPAVVTEMGLPFEGFHHSRRPYHESPPSVLVDLAVRLSSAAETRACRLRTSAARLANSPVLMQAANLFPTVCSSLTRYAARFRREDDELFRDFGAPRYYDSSPRRIARICTLNMTAIRDDAKLLALLEEAERTYTVCPTGVGGI